MSKILIGVLLGACLLLTAAYMQSRAQLDALQRENGELQMAAAKAERSVAAAERMREDARSAVTALEQQLAATKRREEAVVRKMLQQEAPDEQPGVTTAIELDPAFEAQPAEEPGEKKGPMAGYMKKLQELMDKPEMREAMRSQQKMMLNTMYGALFDKLKLDPERLELFKDLLVDQQMAGFSAMGAGGPADIQEVHAGTNDAVRELLSEEEFDVFEDYQNTLAERLTISQLEPVLTQKAIPLTEVQKEELITLMVEERLSVALPDPKEQQKRWLQGGFDEADVEKLLKQQEDMNQRIQDRASEVLSDAQVEALRTFQESQMQMQRLGMQMMKGFMGTDSEEQE